QRNLQIAWLLGKSGNRAFPYTVAAGQLRQGSRLPRAALALLSAVPVSGRGAAHVLSLGLAAAPSFSRPHADQVALHVRQAAEYRQHQAPGAGAGVGPRLCE